MWVVLVAVVSIDNVPSRESYATPFTFAAHLGYFRLRNPAFTSVALLLRHRLELNKAMMDCLYAKCIPCVTDCVMAELEKLGRKFRLAMKIARDPRVKRLTCQHKGTYADDCLVDRVTQHRCFIVATCDRDLKRRIRKVPGVPIMFIQARKYSIERMPDAFGAPK
jgi:U3 small nucleolar RNA-associated protein 24